MIRIIQIKYTKILSEGYLTHARIAEINNLGNNRCCWTCGERGHLLHCWWKCKVMQQLWKTVWRFLRMLKIELSYYPAVVLLVISPKDIKILIHSVTFTLMFIAAISTIAKLWKKPKCPLTDEWIKRCVILGCLSDSVSWMSNSWYWLKSWSISMIHNHNLGYPRFMGSSLGSLFLKWNKVK